MVCRAVRDELLSPALLPAAAVPHIALQARRLAGAEGGGLQ